MLTLINPGRQQGLRYLFNLADPQSAPEYIDMGAIQPTIDMSFNGFAKLNDYSQLLYCEETGSNLSGLQTKTWRVLSYGQDDGSGDEQIVVPTGFNFVVWGVKQHIYMLPAQAAAMAGKYISSELLMNTPVGKQITKWHGTTQVNANVELYAPGHYWLHRLTREHIQVVPSGTSLDLVWWVQDGTNFAGAPGNIECIYCIVGQAFPEGAPLPLGI